MLPAIITMWKGLHFGLLNLKIAHLDVARFLSRFPFASSFQSVFCGQQTFFNRHLIQILETGRTETKFLVKGSKNSLTETFAWECSVLVIENLNFDNLPVWISHLRASAFCGSLVAAFWCGSVCSCFLKLSRCKRRTCPISAVQMEFCLIAFHPNVPFFTVFFTWGLPSSKSLSP